MDDSRFSVSAPDLHARLGSARSPVVVDVRRPDAFDGRLLAGAIRGLPDDVMRWQSRLPAERPSIVYCAHGGAVSRDVAARLRDAGVDARFLEGGIAAWQEQGRPTRTSPVLTREFVTRERPKVDRVACPWLVRRFVDPDAVFTYMPTGEVLSHARCTGAIAYDIPGAEPFSHDGDRCSFDAFLRQFELRDPALERLALIVRGADTAQLQLAPEASGLLAVSLGLSRLHADDDHTMLEQGMIVYDALYAFCRACEPEEHRWTPA